MTQETPTRTPCAKCGADDNRKTFMTITQEQVEKHDNSEWTHWCDPCITESPDELNSVLIHPDDWRFIPREEDGKE